jgi:single-strand DNA-binding protein
MANETILSIIGNTTGTAELRFTPAGAAVASFTVASTPRTFDRNSNEWKDGTTLFMRVSAWRELGENVAETLDQKGMRVVVTGRLSQREFEKDGQKRTVIELEADEVAPSLKYANAKVVRKAKGDFNQGGKQQGGKPQWGNQPASDPWGAPQGQTDAGQWGNGPASEPKF